MKENLGQHDFSKDYPNSEIIQKSMKTAFIESQEDVCKMPQDTRYSGSTCVSVMTLGRKLYIANVGDSRGIVIKSMAGPNGTGDPNQCTC